MRRLASQVWAGDQLREPLPEKSWECVKCRDFHAPASLIRVARGPVKKLDTQTSTDQHPPRPTYTSSVETRDQKGEWSGALRTPPPLRSQYLRASYGGRAAGAALNPMVAVGC